MARPIGYYVHHHGDGHRQRALAIARHMGGRLTLLGTGLAGRTDGHAAVDLPDDRFDGAGFDGRDRAERPDALHYAPLDHDGIRRRVAAVTEWIGESRPALLIVDVSVEIAMLARLASVPTVYVRLNGCRLDPPHLEAYRGATALLAPFHADLDDVLIPPAIRQQTFYAPGIMAASSSPDTAGDVILGVVGKGGGLADGTRWAAAAGATPDLRWQVLGPCTMPKHIPANLRFLGWVDEPADLIAGAAVVVGAAGDGLVGSVIAARRPFVCIPETRPFDEQRSKARQLATLGAAIVASEWPAPAAWPSLIDQARRLDPDALAALDCEDGAKRAADWLMGIADTGTRAIGGAECSDAHPRDLRRDLRTCR